MLRIDRLGTHRL